MRTITWVVVLVIAVYVGYLLGRQSNNQLPSRFNKTLYTFTDYGDELPVKVYGTFIVKDENGSVLEGKNDPTGVSGHTVEIICDKSSMTCEEKQAYIGSLTNAITIGDPKTFDIDQWSNKTIASKPLSLDQCTTETLVVDRISKTANTINTLSNKNGICASMPPPTWLIITVQ